MNFSLPNFDKVTIFTNKLNKFGKEETEFGELAKIFEENEFDVVIEPSGILWPYMVDHWPKTKFIQLTREITAWKKSFMNKFNKFKIFSYNIEILFKKIFLIIKL